MASSGHWRLATLALSAFIGVMIGIGNLGVGMERMLRELRAGLYQHQASGMLHIVEIDARSIAAIDRWPWPRVNYAQVVDQLRKAGAASVAFDVDFSSKANAADDAAFAAALARAEGKAILPTFGQHAGGGKEGWMDSLPVPILRDQATLAAVSIRPDADGYVRKAPFGTVTAGVPRPSLSAILAGVGGTVDREFPIDYAIDPLTIPRHSFIDVRDGKVDPRQLTGKQVIIGATAVEMGDRYAVPNYGVIPGVVIQALAAETLARGIPRQMGWALPLVLALVCAGPILRVRRRVVMLAVVVAAPLALMGGATMAQARFNLVFEIVPAFALLAVTSTAAMVMRLLAAGHRQRAHDPQTGLPNRLALRSARANGSRGIVAARFTEFDKLSAALGEQAIADLIRRVHDRIALVTAGSPVYRVEDRVLAWTCSELDSLDDRLAALRTLMLSPVEVAGRRIDVMLALGFAAHQPQDQGEGALAQALMAADQALASGHAWHIHDPLETRTAELELSLLGELDDAILKGEIDVLYQPKLCLRSDRIVSVEALVRWKHSTRGYLRPDLFIPLAERSDRIAGLTLHVVERTMADLAAWGAQGHVVTGAVNISAKLLNSSSFLSALRELVGRGAVPPSRLVFEVTESAAMTDTAQAAAALRSFRDLGIAISMDDYGTGQSTLSYIKQLPLNELKIDRSFVQFAHQNRSDGLLVQSTINLAHDLGLKVVAEGVEDRECLNFLRSSGCDLAQGYLISKPVSSAQLRALLAGAEAKAA